MRRPHVAWIGSALLVSSLAACSTTPPEEDPVQIRLHDLDTRLARIERVMANQSLLEVSNQIEALRSDVRGMHNDVDLLNNAMDASRRQQRDLYADLDRRMKALEARGALSGVPSGASPALGGGGGTLPGSNANVSASAAAPAAQAGPGGYDGAAADDKSGYQSAFTFLKDGQYDRAVPAFQKFLATYPDSALAENAQYWLGEANYVNKAYPEAEAAFQKVIDKYPQSRKVPDALLKIGYCRYEMKQYESAKLVLSQVITQFPDNADAKLAQQRIEKMAAEKH
jgi:tol-pal system protein YbgF